MGIKKRNTALGTPPVFFVFFILLVNVVPVLHLNTIPDTVLMPRLLLVNLVLLGFYLYIYLRKKQNTIDLSVIKNPIVLLLVGLSIITLASVFWAINPGEALFDIVKTFALTMLVFTAVQVLTKSSTWFYQLSKLVVIASIITTVVGYYQYMEYVLPDPDRKINGLVSVLYLVKGFMGHKNQLSIALMLYLPFLFFGVLRFRNLWRVASISAFGLNLLLILILETRSVWVGTLFATASLFLISIIYHKVLNVHKNTRYLFVGLIMAGVVSLGGVIVFAVSTEGAVHKKFDPFLNPENVRNIHRINTWKMSLDMSKDSPITGVGAGNWKIVAPAYQNGAGITIQNFNWLRPHNDFLWMLTEKGVFGFLIFILIFIFAFRGVFRVVQTEKDADKRLFVLLISGGLVGYVVVSLFTFPVERIHHQVFLAIYLATIIVSERAVGKKSVIKTNPNIVIIGVVLISTFGMVYAMDMIRMERHLYKANRALNGEDWKTVIKEAKHSRSIFRNIDHDNIPVSWYLGMAYFNTGELALAERQYTKAVKASPYNPVVLNNFGQLLVEKGDYKQAKKVLKSVLNLYPYHPEAIVNLTTCFYQMGKYQVAFKTIRQLKYRDRTPEIKNNIKVLRKLKNEQVKQKKSKKNGSGNQTTKN